MTDQYEIRILPHDETGEIDVEHFEITDAVSALEHYEELKVTDGCDPQLLVLKWPNDYDDCIEYGLDSCCDHPFSKLPKYVKAAMMKVRPDIFEYLSLDYHEGFDRDLTKRILNPDD